MVLIIKRTYYFFWLVASGLLISCGSGSNLPSLTETYSRSDKNPFGTYVAFQHINQLFYHNDIKVKKTSTDKYLADNIDTSSLHINISKSFYPSSADLTAMLAFVEKGNNVFISSEYFDTSFLKQLHIAVKGQSLITDFFNSMRYTAVRLQQPYYFDNTAFSYYYLPFNNSFEIKDSAYKKILGTNENREPNFIVAFYGRGRFFLHCEPRVFSNYFLLQEDNFNYMQQAFSFVPAIPEHVYWDDYYNKHNSPSSTEGGGSGFSVLLKYPAMAWAFWLTLLSLLLYILLGGKRRQRIIKPLKPVENTSVAFTETVSRLYLQKKNNRNIADKMITYFFEHIRNHYFISTASINEVFCSALSRKSNVPREEVDLLMNVINKIQNQNTVSDEQLLALNNKIENFYKYRQ